MQFHLQNILVFKKYISRNLFSNKCSDMYACSFLIIYELIKNSNKNNISNIVYKNCCKAMENLTDNKANFNVC